MSAQKLLAVLDDDALGDEQVASVLPWLVLGLAQNADLAKLPADEQLTIGEMFHALGIHLGDDVEQMVAVTETWPPPDPALLKRLTAALREILSESGGAGAASAVQKLLGSERVQGTLERKAPPPAGAVAGGPMARFAALAELGKKDGD